MTDWMRRALCAEVSADLWFPEPSDYSIARAAKDVCSRCDVATACLTHALADPSLHGIWGGTTRRQRLDMRSTAAERRAAS